MGNLWRSAFLMVCGALLAAPAISVAGGISDVSSAEAGKGVEKRSVASATERTAIIAQFASLPLRFEENQGQTATSVDYFVRGARYDAFISATELVVRLSTHTHGVASKVERSPSTFRARFVGASNTATHQGKDRLHGTTNYITGSRGGVVTADILSYAKVGYEGVYPGIDVVYYGNGGELQYDFIVAPGVDPGAIRLALEGTGPLYVKDNGDVSFAIDGREFKMTKPLIYQLIGGKRQLVEGGYKKAGDSELVFALSEYDIGEPLIIDPVLQYATYLGGGSNDGVRAIAVDESGNAYVAGHSESRDFPLVNAYDTRIGRGDRDVFVAKLDPTGTQIIYATFIGGSKGTDYATGIAVDSNGSAYIVGTAGPDYPTTSGSYQTIGGDSSGFVTKLNPQGNGLVYSTFVSGVQPMGVAVGNDGAAYLGGSATSNFETTPLSLMPSWPGGASVAFVAKLRPDGAAMDYATYLGGSDVDYGSAIAADPDGNAYIVGSTLSTDFPTHNALQAIFQGAGSYRDGFLSILDPQGSTLLFSSFIGGELTDSVNGIALDKAGNIFLAGETYSIKFPVEGGFQAKAGSNLVNSSQGNAFVMKLAPFGRAIAYSSYLGGEICRSTCQSVFGVAQTSGDAAYGITVDQEGQAIVTGMARSYTFPRLYSQLPAKTDDNAHSMFVTKISASGAALLYSSLVAQGVGSGTGEPHTGGSRNIAAVVPGAVYLGTSLWDTFTTTPGTFQTLPQGGSDGMVFRLDSGPLSIVIGELPERIRGGESVQLVATVSHETLPGNIVFLSGRTQIGTASVQNGTATTTVVLAPGVHSLSAIHASSEISGSSPVKHLVVDSNSTCN